MASIYDVHSYMQYDDNKFIYEETLEDENGKMWVFKSLKYSTSVFIDSPVYEKKRVYYKAFSKVVELRRNNYEVKPNMVKLGLCKNIEDYKTVDFSIELYKGVMNDWSEFTGTVPYTPVPSAEGLRL